MPRDGSDPYGDLRHRIECRHVVFPGIRTSWVPVSFCSYRIACRTVHLRPIFCVFLKGFPLCRYVYTYEGLSRRLTSCCTRCPLSALTRGRP